jgi:hypothetical protein
MYILPRTPCGECECLSHFDEDLLSCLVGPAIRLNSEGTPDHHLRQAATQTHRTGRVSFHVGLCWANYPILAL